MKTVHNNSYSDQTTKAKKPRNYQERSVSKFLKKVFSILEGNTFSELICWSSDGTAIIIKNPVEFSNHVLPQYFKHSNFSSFIRQLNMYQFKKLKSYVYDHTYTHPMFRRGRIELLWDIQRKTFELTKLRAAEPPELKVKVDVGKVMYENNVFKKLHKELTNQVELIEGRMNIVKDEVVKLYEDKLKSEANERFLKEVMKSLVKRYGFETIATVIESQARESESPEANFQQDRRDHLELTSTTNNRSTLEDGEDYNIIEETPESSPDRQHSDEWSTEGVLRIGGSSQSSNAQRNSLHPGDMLPGFRLAGSEYENFDIPQKFSQYQLHKRFELNELDSDMIFTHPISEGFNFEGF